MKDTLVSQELLEQILSQYGCSQGWPPTEDRDGVVVEKTGKHIQHYCLESRAVETGSNR